MVLAVGDQAPDFKLPATDGGIYSLQQCSGESATVILFWCNHCPYVMPSQQRIIDMQAAYAGRGVRFAAICANNAQAYPADSFENMKQRVEEMGYNFPYLHDESQETARAYGAQRTPEAFLFDSAGLLRYHGRIDDNHADVARAYHHDLRNAIEAVLAGKLPDPAETGALGCTIKWK
jgi:peroxiredoxin